MGVQFVLAFAETFKSGQGLSDFFDEAVDKDVQDLKDAQTMASFDTLFDVMGDRISKASKDYFKERLWMKHDPKCAFTEVGQMGSDSSDSSESSSDSSGNVE